MYVVDVEHTLHGVRMVFYGVCSVCRGGAEHTRHDVRVVACAMFAGGAEITGNMVFARHDAAWNVRVVDTEPT